MGEIRIISSCTIRATSCCDKSIDRIELTPWDLRFLFISPIQRGLLFRNSPPTVYSRLENKLVALHDHLKASLSTTLSFFPPLAGRLSAVNNNDDTTTSFFISCNNAGAEFTHAVIDGLTVNDILEPEYIPPAVHSFFPMKGVQNHQGVSKPLLAVQLTELVDGHFIGVTMNHVVADGSSFWHFFSSWSEISRGFENISRTPFLNRWLPEDIQYPIRIPFFERQKQQLDDKEFKNPLFQERMFHFTKSKIAELKSKANSEMGTTKLSSLQSIMAHLWRSVTRCQNHLCVDDDMNLVLSICARQRLINPPLPENYFGNAINDICVTAKAGDLVDRKLGWVGMEINKTIGSRTSDEMIRSDLKWWVKSPRILTPSSMKTKTLIMTSSPRFDIYGNDFGWGSPVAVRSGPANCNMITVYQGIEEGSVDVRVCLLPEVLIALKNDGEFMEAVTP